MKTNAPHILVICTLACLAISCQNKSSCIGEWVLAKQLRNDMQVTPQEGGVICLSITDTTISSTFHSNQIYLGKKLAMHLVTYRYWRHGDSLKTHSNKKGMVCHIVSDTLILKYLETSAYRADSIDRMTGYYIRDSACCKDNVDIKTKEKR